jgi:SPX domain protein involved in polyphosphate accumulation
MTIKRFDRYELKYVITHAQYETLRTALKGYMISDKQGDEYGRYPVTSLYFDTSDYRAYWDKVEGHRFRRKVRVRVYGDQTVTAKSTCFVEIKQRINKTVQKRRILAPYQAAMALCGAGEKLPAGTKADQVVIDEIHYLHHTLHLQPACVVGYQRMAFNGTENDPGLRVTFDSALKGRTHHLSLLTTEQGESQFFMPANIYILEVKANYRVPNWLTELVNGHRCQLRRVSKYCAALENSKTLLQTQRFS